MHCRYNPRTLGPAPKINPNANSTKFRNALQSKGLECHIWSKREIEFYLPESVLIAAQQGDQARIARVLEIRSGDQTQKFRTAASAHKLCVPSGKNLRNLLKEHLTSRELLDQEVRDIIEQKLIPWRNAILGE